MVDSYTRECLPALMTDMVVLEGFEPSSRTNLVLTRYKRAALAVEL